MNDAKSKFKKNQEKKHFEKVWNIFEEWAGILIYR